MENIADIVRENIRRLVEDHSNPRKVAIKAKVDYAHLNRILNGHRAAGLDTLEALAKFFRVPIATFFSATYEPSPMHEPGTTLTDAWKILKAFEKAGHGTRQTILALLNLAEVSESDLDVPKEVSKPGSNKR